MSTSAIKLVVISNPFDPVESARRGELEFVEGKSFAEYMGDIDDTWGASLNGEVLEREQWYLVYPNRGDTIVVSAIPYGGGGGGKTVLRLVAVIALSYVTGGIASGSIGGLTGATANAAAAAVAIGGTMIINAVLPPPTPDVNDNRDISDSPTYGQDQATNTSESGIPIPLTYGRYRVAGNIIGSYVENVNDEQFLYIMYNAGEGEIAGFDDILINNQPISNFNEVEYQTRNGTSDQTAIGWFDTVRRQFNVGSTIVANEWRTYTFRDLSDRASLEITFPQGLYGIDSGSGNKYQIGVTFDIQYRVYYPNQSPNIGWQVLPWVTNSGRISREPYTISGKQTSAVRRTVKTADLGDNQTFEIRIRRRSESDSDYINDTAVLSTVTQISRERIRYKHTAIIAMRILMTEQLNRTPNVSYINRGIVCNVWNTDQNKFIRQATDNPAWIAYDILTNDRYGAGIPKELIKLDKFIEWGDWCFDQDLKFNGVLDTASNAFDILEPVMRLGHAKLFTIGTRISVTIEKTDYPVMMFSQANMIKDSFSINWMPLSDRANEVEVSYFDKTANYAKNVVKVYDEQSMQNGDPQRPTSFTLIGCTDEATAFYEGLLAINYNKYITQSYSFQASIDAIACTLGSVVYIQHDMPQWGYAGRIQGINTLNTVNIDIDPANMESEPDVIMVQHSAISQGTGAISNRYGDIIEVDVVLPNTKGDRIQISGRDYPIGAIELHPTFSRIKLNSELTGFVGEECEVFETDVFDERTVLSIENGTVTVDIPFSAIPERFNQYLIGRTETIKKRARITSIDYSDDHTRTISAFEYNASVYDKNIPFTPSPIQPDLGFLEDTVLANIDEELIQIGKNLRPRLTISYRNGSTRYQTTQVFISTDGGPYRLINTHRREITYESEDGAVLDIKLVPVDAGGIAKPIDSVDPIRYIVLGKTAPPAQVQNFTISKEVGGLQLSWDAVTELDIEGYEIRRGVSWDDGEIITQALSSTVLFFPVSEPGDYEFMIRAVDSSGNLSQEPTFAEIELIRPERVYNFNAVQHIDKVVMQWDRPLDRNITSFWIREGESWDNSYIHGSVTGTTFELPAAKGAIRENTVDDDSRTFWIKAVDIIGIDSEQAVFANTSVAHLPDRNLVFNEYHGRIAGGPASRAPGLRLNVSGNYPIQLNDRVNYGEYIAQIGLPYQTRARNSVGLEVGVLVRNNTTWDQAIFSWNDQEANSGWAGVGDPEKIDFQQFISLKYTGQPQFYPNTTYLFSLNQKLTCEITGISPDSATGVNYQPTRYNYGVEVGATTNVQWTISGSETWSIASWVQVPETITTDLTGVGGTIEVEGQPNIHLILSAVTRQIIMRQRGFRDLAVDDVTANPGDLFYVAVSQENGTRTLRVRNLAWDVTRKTTLDIGSASKPVGVGLGFY